MQAFIDFFMTSTFLGFITALLIFSSILFCVPGQRTVLSMVLTLLVFSVATGAVFNHHQILQCYLGDYKVNDPANRLNKESLFKKQITQALEDIQIEVVTEKENLLQLMEQVEEIVDQVDAQRQKLHQFIGDTAEILKGKDQKTFQEKKVELQ
jgi:hypothetical protein